MDFLAQTSLLVAMTSFGMGLSVLSRQVTNKLFLAFSAACGGVFIWSVAFFLEKAFGGGHFYSLHLLAGAWIGPLALTFLRTWSSGMNRVLWLASLASAILLTGGWAWTGDVHYWDSSTILRSLLYFSPGFVVLQILLTLLNRRPLTLRDSVVLVGALLVLAFSTMDHVPALGPVVPALGNLMLCAYLILLGQAIRQQRLIDLPALLTRFAMLLVLALVLSILYLLLVAWIQDDPMLFFLNSFAVSFVIVTVIDPLQRWAAGLSERLLASRSEGLRRMLESAEMALQESSDLKSWEKILLATVDRAVGSTNSMLVLLQRTPSAATGLLLEEIRHRRREGLSSVLLDLNLESELNRTASRSRATALAGVLRLLRAQGHRALLPISGENLLGWVTLSFEGPLPPQSGMLKSWGQLEMVAEFLGKAGRGLELLLRVRSEAERERLALLGEMAASLAHEIRNPLGAIRGAAELLPQNDGNATWTGVIREEVGRLNQVVSQFLAYSRRSDFRFQTVDLIPWLSRAIERLHAALEAAGMHQGLPLVRLDESFPVQVRVDPDGLLQVLENLVRNSIQAGANVIRIQVALDTEGSTAEIFVTDNGEGIAVEARESIFQPFVTHRTSGTGLGLSICRRIIEGNQGSIVAVDSQEKGARIRIRLPLHMKEQE